ncbi:MAG: sugar transferase [Bacteroidetes bacterium]|nr:sugar transferase [Bacteroidota bacterium]
MFTVPHLILFLVFLLDLLAFNSSWWIYYKIREWVQPQEFKIVPEELWLTSLIMTFYWVLLFFLSGLYQVKTIVSRFDEIVQVIKATLVGTLIISFLIFLDETRISQVADVKFVIFLYWVILTVLALMFRIAIRTLQRALLVRGILARKTVVIGNGKRAILASQNLLKYPALGFHFSGFVTSDTPSVKLEPALGPSGSLKKIIKENGIHELIVATELEDRKFLTEVLKIADSTGASVKIIPDLYDVVSGQARTQQIYGFPLIDLNPHFLTPLERAGKRTFDILFSLAFLLAASPVILLSILIIKLESKGPVFFIQERAGKNGRLIRVIKFRSMVADAEKLTGPVLATKDDPRITKFGRFMRKTRIDEFPQLINVLKGDMSVVGPRPERQHFIDKYREIVPFYERRLKVQPGITGLAQVKGSYENSLEDVFEKLKYDLYYIENMSFKMDLTILFHTVFTMLKMKGQ